jgi:putative sigma-54 modulation protein
MKLLIHGRNLEVTPAIRDYTEEKLQRAIGHFDGMVKEADVHLSVARNPRVPQQTAEVTVFANGTVIRAQERSESLYGSCGATKTATATTTTAQATTPAPPRAWRNSPAMTS